MRLRKFVIALVLLLVPAFAFAQFDPCASDGTAKLSVKVAITTATTTTLVTPLGTTTIYVCSFSLTISQVVTTANTIKFIHGTGAACVTNPIDLTGAYGSGGVVANIPIVVATSSSRGTLFKTPAAGGLCATTTIGATAFFHGVVTYVQQ